MDHPNADAPTAPQTPKPVTGDATPITVKTDAPDPKPQTEVQPVPAEATRTEPETFKLPIETDGDKPDAPSASPRPMSASLAQAAAQMQTEAEKDAVDKPANGIVLPPKRRVDAPWLLILVVIAVAAVLIAGVVFVYMKEQNKASVAGPTSGSQAQNTAANAKVTPQDVDAAAKDIDTSLSEVDETKDLSGSDLTDQNLGL